MADLSHEPSMEEILASIKRVIAEDPPQPPRARPEPAEAAARAADEAVLELDRPVPGTEPLVSPGALDQTRGAFTALASVAPQPVGDGPLEAVVREMLRPLLREWLDDRLPQIVEQLVTREIARITGRKL